MSKSACNSQSTMSNLDGIQLAYVDAIYKVEFMTSTLSPSQPVTHSHNNVFVFKKGIQQSIHTKSLMAVTNKTKLCLVPSPHVLCFYAALSLCFFASVF